MNSEKEEDVLDLLSRLLERAQQAVEDRHGCHIELVYVASGGQHIGKIENQNICHGEAVKDGETSQRVEDVVEERIRYHIQMAGDRPKDVLRPYVAARRAKCVKLMSVDEFNRHYATNVAKSSYSDWVGENPKYCYSDDELKPYEDEFLRLKEGTLPSPVGT